MDNVGNDIEALRRAEGRIRTLLEISNAIVTNLTQAEFLQAVSHALRRILSFDGAAIALYVPEKDVFRLLAVESQRASEYFRPGRELSRVGNSIGWVFDNRLSIVRKDLFKEQEYANEQRLAAMGMHSHCIVPLIVRGTCIGALALFSEQMGLYTSGDVEFLEKVANQVALAVENMKAYEQIRRLKVRLERENTYLREELRRDHDFHEIIGNSPALLSLLDSVERVASADSNVLITGETGTGKELIARALHSRSPRRNRPLVKVNCGSLPAGLVESELFGHVKGAFTGAMANRIGRFELANRGTLFLDEVGELPLETQVKLLRVLQEQEFEPVGSSRTIRVDVRVVAATNRILEEQVKAGQFRADLYYRLNVIPLSVPPLRERRPDIPELVMLFLQRFSRKSGRKVETVSQETMDLLVNYRWPGNIRELQNVIERGVVLSRGPVMSLARDSFSLGQDSDDSPMSLPKTDIIHAVSSRSSLEAPSLEEIERRHISSVVAQTRGRISGPNGAASILKVNPNTLRSRMKKLGIPATRSDIA